MTKFRLCPGSSDSLGRSARSCFLLLCWLAIGAFTFAQMETATVSGTVMDHSGAVIADAQVQVTNSDTNVIATTSTNKSGVYVVPSLKPGRYRIAVTKLGFKQVVVTDVILNVQDVVSRNFNLEVGAISESITVTADQLNLNTTDATVSTVVDRNFAENLPLNGRSFQTLIELTPGVVLTTSNQFESGQFSVNGQRASSNYWMVDGVSANIGVGASTSSNGFSGSLGAFSVFGGTNSLVSVDALQEFRIQTSTFAPEFGREPGGQISIITRSGTNQWHGTIFDYFRNDALDANDWFANYLQQRKPEERQNDFGGTLSGPIVKGKTFFFFSYEGLRLRLPQVTQTTVPDASFTSGGTTNSRVNAIPALQPYLNAFPLPNPNSPEIFVPCDPTTDPTCPPTGQKATGSAAFNASYSNRGTLDAYSLRVDHKLNDNWILFARYDYSPSELVSRGSAALSMVFPFRITTQTATIGATWVTSPSKTNDLRFNYSRVDARSSFYLDSLGGAVPLPSLPFPSPFTAQSGQFTFQIFSLVGGGYSVGPSANNVQRQINIVDNFSLQAGSHSLKFGVDFRRLSPQFTPSAYEQGVFIADVPSAQIGNFEFATVGSSRNATLLFRNLSAFAQDTWRITPRLSLTYGLRWDVDFAPGTLNGPNISGVTGYNINDLSNLALAPPGTPPFRTRYASLAPRLGAAYELSQNPKRQTVLRGGFGVFYDLATSEVGNILNPNTGAYPYQAVEFLGNGTFPLDPASATPPPIVPPGPTTTGLTAFDPNLNLPYTLQWNVAVEQGLGSAQSLSLSYLGAAGRRLIQSTFVFQPNVNYLSALVIGNSAKSDYDALQLQFQRRLSRGLQMVASYSWSHSTDTGSAGSFGNAANTLVPGIDPNANHGASDFDIRNAFSASITYEVPSPKINSFARAAFGGWSTQNIVIARSAPPVNVFDPNFPFINNGFTSVRPDMIPGQPLYLYGPRCASVFQTLGELAAGQSCPGGKGFNPGAFTPPPIDPNTGAPTRQGNLPRNALRGFGAVQWDFAVHRDFPIHESIKLQFRAELFNVLNHPNFGQPDGVLSNPTFGRSTQMLGRSLDSSNQGSGSFSSLYQIGGPRSIQLGLKLMF